MNDNINLFCRSIEKCGGSYYCMEGVVMCFLHATVYRDANASWLACHSISKSEIQLMDDLNDVVEKANSIVQMLYEYACKKLKNDPDMLSAIRRKIGKVNSITEKGVLIMSIKNIEAKKVSNGWILTVYDEDRNLFTTTIHVSAEQLIEKLTDLLFPELEEKIEALPPEVRQHLIERDALNLSKE